MTTSQYPGTHPRNIKIKPVYSNQETNSSPQDAVVDNLRVVLRNKDWLIVYWKWKWKYSQVYEY